MYNIYYIIIKTMWTIVKYKINNKLFNKFELPLSKLNKKIEIDLSTLFDIKSVFRWQHKILYDEVRQPLFIERLNALIGYIGTITPSTAVIHDEICE